MSRLLLIACALLTLLVSPAFAAVVGRAPAHSSASSRTQTSRHRAPRRHRIRYMKPRNARRAQEPRTKRGPSRPANGRATPVAPVSPAVTPKPAATPATVSAPAATLPVAPPPATPVAAPAAASLPPAPVPSQSSPAALRWSPPPLVNPLVVNVPTSYFGATFPTDRDVILVMPAQTRWSTLDVTGGHNIRLIGGSTVLDTSNGATAVMRFSKVSGSVFIEGTNIDVNGHEDDAIDVAGSTAAPYTLTPDVYIENSRIVGLDSTFTGNHADIFQPQGSIGRLFIDRLTGQSNYQGLFIPPQFPIKSATISRTNLSYGPGGQAVTYLLWFLDPGSTRETPYPVTLQDVWIAPRDGQRIEQAAVAPWSGTSSADGTPIGAIASSPASVTWPTIDKVTGGVSSGRPPAGDFVPAGSVGIGYVSPGYAG